jgi:predicted MFS family arabinose efflux permease
MPTMPRSLVALFACASGLSVANVYYAQPLLDALAANFGIGRAAVGGVVTATQAGSVLALLLLVPLGDRLPRRRLLLAQLAALVLALLAVCMASGAAVLMAAMLAVGMFGTAMTQGLIASAASAAGPHERGRVVGAAQGGVVAGLLLARVFAGLVADLAGWRAVYGAAALLMLALGALLWRCLPSAAPPHTAERASSAAAAPVPSLTSPHAAARTSSAAATAQSAAAAPLSWLGLLGSTFTLLRRDRVLQMRGVIALLMFAAFNVFWSTLALMLSAPPYRYSHTQIGAFGLVGLTGALAAARAGRWADRGRAQRASGLALGLMLLCWLPLAWAPTSLAALMAGILALDLGVQALHVTNQSLILQGDAHAHSRLIGAYMMFYALGSGGGALAATAVYAQAGWHGACLLGAGLSLAALLFWFFTKWPVRIAKLAGPI